MPTGRAIDGRTRHYGTFYGLSASQRTDGGGSETGETALPLLLVWGNCQAEALRVLLSGSAGRGFTTVRIPPVFELTAADVEHVRALVGRAAMLISQPVKDDYRDLPLGTAQIAAMMPPGATVVRWPVIRTSAYHPFQAIVRDPSGTLGDPPIVPYHDLRTLASARDGEDRWDSVISVAACRKVADLSIAELRRREQAQCDVAVSDLFDNPSAGDMFTLNHPGNRILLELANRILALIGGPADAADPGRDLLGEVKAPVPAQARAALGLPGVAATNWQVGGKEVAAQEIHQVQWQWYRDYPRMVEAGIRRHRESLEILGLG
ncbi:MAG: WcbI family polysaccharide biosynthesis putative acetyltransferase [Nakamurella sp.]